MSKIYADENPLFMGQFHQAFKNASFLADFGYTEGYKNTTLSKKLDKNLIFSRSLSKILKVKMSLIAL